MEDQPLEIRRVEVRGVIWYDVQIPMSSRTVVVRGLTEEQLKRLRDAATDALRDVE